MSKLVDGRYELLEVLASGGMATVWRARDTRLERLVALKRPHPAPAESKLHERMGREARAVAGVSHPNLVTMFDTGRDEGGPYLIMELLEGPTLASPGREIGASEAVAIGAQIADALAAVHEAGIVHRDVKPSNVILSERGPCLTDFGIASIDETTRELTQPGTIVATPSYAAPEVLAGDPPSPASDVFSLAALVYGLLTRKPPYQGIDRPSLPGLSDRLIDAVIRSGLATDPGERPSARDLAARLRASAPTQAMPAAHDTLLMPSPNDPVPLAATDASPLADTSDTVALPLLPTGAPEPSPEPVPQPTQAPEPVLQQPAGERSGRLRLAAILLAGAVVAIAAWAASPLVGPTDNVSQKTVSVSKATPVTLSGPNSVPVDPVAAAADRLDAILAGIRPPELKPKDRREIMEKVDEAIFAASDDPAEAEKALEEAAAMIGKELSDDPERDAFAALAELAAALGLDFSPDGEGDD